MDILLAQEEKYCYHDGTNIYNIYMLDIAKIFGKVVGIASSK